MYNNITIKDATNRCLSCKKPSCETGCPIHNHIRDFIKALKDNDLDLAKNIVYDNSNLAFICSIVCPHEKNCVGHCILNKAKKEPVDIGGIEAYITSTLNIKKDIVYTDKKVAIIGAGPSGIYAAVELAKHGIKSHIYERESHIGGVLYYGIPDFRLGNDRLNMLNKLMEEYDIEISLNTLVDNKLFKEIKNNYGKVIIACGLSKARPSGLPNSKYLLEASTILKEYNLKARYNVGTYPNLGKEVFVMGAGNVAMDVARVAAKLGVKTTIVYRRSLEESPANKVEIEEAIKDGVIFRFLENPVDLSEEDNKLVIKIEKMKLGEPDESGRRRPIGTKEYTYEKVDYLIEAIGDIPGIEIDGIDTDHGYIITDNNYKTSDPNIYSIGDITLGAKTVVEACNSAKIAVLDLIKNIS